MSYRHDTEQSADESVSTFIVSPRPKRQYLKAWPEEMRALVLMRCFRLIEETDAGETIPAMVEMLAQYKRVLALKKGHPRFSGVEVDLVANREVKGVAEAIRLAAKNLTDQADHLERCK